MPGIQPAAITIQVDTSKGLSSEQVRLMAAELILRTLALTKKREPRKALVRVTQLNALVDSNPSLPRVFPGIGVFLRYGRYYCTNPSKIKRKALVFLSLKAAPVIDELFESLETYLIEQRRLAELSAIKTPRKVVRAPVEHKYVSIGNRLEDLKNVMPRILEAEERYQASKAKVVAKRINKPSAASAPQDEDDGILSSDDVYILQEAGKVKFRELAPGQSGIVRISAVLPNTYVSEVARRAVAVDYGMQRCMSYMMMTEALAVGVSRFNEYGDPRPHDEIVDHAQRLVSARNRVRNTQHLDSLGIIFTTGSSTRLTKKELSHSGGVNTASHTYFLLFDNRFLADQQITCKRWEFFRKPGTNVLQLSA